MLDFGWPELLVIAAVAVLVVGPQDIPNIMRSLGRVVRRLRYVRFALAQQFDSLIQDDDIDELRRSVNFEAGKGKAGKGKAGHAVIDDSRAEAKDTKQNKQNDSGDA